MSDLTQLERLRLEKLFGMATGYVLNFSNRTFQEFVATAVGIDIYDEKYNYWSGSKANRLRAFWDEEPNHLAAKLTGDLLEYWHVFFGLDGGECTAQDTALYEECKKIVERLRRGTLASQLGPIKAATDEERFGLLIAEIESAIGGDRPEAALDRLHTYMVAKARDLCAEHGLTYEKGTTLNALFGRYVKWLSKTGHIESDMTSRILKSSISVLDAYNEVRNDKSLAHPNPVLNRTESELVFKHISALLAFVQSIEENIAGRTYVIRDEDIPF